MNLSNVVNPVYLRCDRLQHGGHPQGSGLTAQSLAPDVIVVVARVVYAGTLSPAQWKIYTFVFVRVSQAVKNSTEVFFKEGKLF